MASPVRVPPQARREARSGELHVVRLMHHSPPGLPAFRDASTYHEHDATRWIPAHLAKGCSPNNVEVDTARKLSGMGQPPHH
jgi:hypothetical protein